MVSILGIGLTSGFCALRARRFLDDDIIANGGTPDDQLKDEARAEADANAADEAAAMALAPNSGHIA